MEKPRKESRKESRISVLRSPQTVELLSLFSRKNKQILEEMKELKYRASVLPVSRRVLSHWRDSNLLDPYGDNQDQISINFVALFWLMIAIELRTFGLPLEKINGIKKYFFDKKKLPLFETYLYLSHTYKNRDFFLVVSSGGDADIGMRNEIEVSESLGLIEDNYIRINFATIRNRIFHNKKEDVFKQRLDDNFVFEKEKEILEMIRDGEYKEITLKFTDGEIVKISSKKFVENPDPIREIKEIIASKTGFCEVNLKMANGKFVSMENVIMKKI